MPAKTGTNPAAIEGLIDVAVSQCERAGDQGCATATIDRVSIPLQALAAGTGKTLRVGYGAPRKR